MSELTTNLPPADCPTWCEPTSTHRPRSHTAKVGEFGAFGTRALVDVQQFSQGEPKVALYALGGDTHAVLSLSAESAVSLAHVLSYVPPEDLPAFVESLVEGARLISGQGDEGKGAHTPDDDQGDGKDRHSVTTLDDDLSRVNPEKGVTESDTLDGHQDAGTDVADGEAPGVTFERVERLMRDVVGEILDESGPRGVRVFLDMFRAVLRGQITEAEMFEGYREIMRGDVEQAAEKLAEADQ